jgi:hypothetical protein
LAFTLACAPLLAACSTRAYAGISFAPGAAEPDLQSLARQARSGDKQAQLQLGIRYEEGRGVPVDLARAERLYFQAATQRSPRRTVAYVATPGGARSSIVLGSPGALEYSGNGEALVRWHRLFLASEPAGHAAVASAAGAAAPDQPLHGDDPESARANAVAMFAYDPIFPGLLRADPDWRTAIAGATGYHFLDDRSIGDSFLYLLDRNGPADPGSSPSPVAAAALCRDGLAGSDWSQPRVRLFILCLARFGATSPDAYRQQFPAARRALDRYPPSRAGESQDAARDRILLLRAAQYCRCAPGAEGLPAEAARDVLRAGADGDVPAFANLLLAFLESGEAGTWAEPGTREALVLSAREVTRRLRNYSAGSRDRFMELTCAQLGLPYDDCRRSYYAGVLLPPRLILIVSEFALAAPGAARCAAVRRRAAEIEHELLFRPTVARQLAQFADVQCAN